MSPEERIDELVAVARKFSEFLDQENEMLGKGEARMSQEHIEQKDFLARTYEGYVKALPEYSEEMAKLDPEKRKTAIEAGDELKEKIAKNVIRLRARYEANMMLVDSYAKAVNEISADTGIYADTGEVMKGTTNGKKRPRSATLNQSL